MTDKHFWHNYRAFRAKARGKTKAERLQLAAVLRAGLIGAVISGFLTPPAQRGEGE